MPANERFPNPKGQIRRKPIRDAVDAILMRDPSDQLDDTPKTIAQEIALGLVRDARSGKPGAREELMDRTEGRPAQSIEHSGMIARTPEEALANLDNQDDATREGDTPPAP
jgi:hypothetical protein